MKKSSLALAIAMGLSGNTAIASDDKTISASIDYLNWETSGPSLDYALQPYPNNGDAANIDPGTDDGTRINFSWHNGDARIMTSWTDYSTDEKDSITDPGNSIIGTLYNDSLGNVSQEGIEDASAEWELDYQNIDLGLGYQLRAGEKLGLELLTGFRIIDTTESFDVRYESGPTFDSIAQEMDVSGYGIYLGIAPTYQFSDNIKVVSSFTASPLAASVERSYIYSTNSGIEANIEEESDKTIVSTTASLGIEGLFFDEMLNVGLGYESTVLQGYPEYLKHTNESGEIVFDHADTNLSFNGFYLRVGGSF